MGKLANPTRGREDAAIADALRTIKEDPTKTVWVDYGVWSFELGNDEDWYADGRPHGPCLIANRGRYEAVVLVDKDGLRLWDTLPRLVNLSRFRKGIGIDRHRMPKFQYTHVRAVILDAKPKEEKYQEVYEKYSYYWGKE